MSSSGFKYYRLSREEKRTLKEVIREILENMDVELAIVFGSFVELDSFRDVDIAVYSARCKLDPGIVAEIASRLEERIRIPVDVVPIGEVSAEFRHYILTRGEVILEKNPGLYEALLMQTLDELAILGKALKRE